MDPGRSERRLAAIMFTDIVGYTALMAESEDRGRRVRERHVAAVRPLVERYHGEWIEQTGDESLSTFASAVDAVNCALAIQAALRYDAELRIRIGVHQGDVAFEDGRVLGDGVNIAARIRPLAEPGGVAVSDEVQHAVQNRENVTTRTLGQQELKNVPRPVEVFSVSGTGEPPRRISKAAVEPRRRVSPMAGWAAAVLGVIAVGAGWWLYRPATDPEPIRSIAVLPLENLSGDPEQEYFADGMTEALIGDLAKIGSLRVISRTSAMRYKGTDLSIPEIAEELGVSGVIEGSVLWDGDEVRITAQLIHGPSDTHLWSESYTNSLTSVIRLQADVALAIAREIRPAITQEEASRIATPEPVDPEAYTEWLKGRHFRSMHSEEGFRRAVQHFERAVALDPRYAAAHADLGMAYEEGSAWGWGEAGENIERAREGIRIAVRLDPDNSDAHAAAGYVALSYDHDWAKAEADLRRALELNPNNAPASKYLVWRLALAKRYAEAIEVAKRAVELDPLNLYALDALADSYAASGQHDRSIEQRMLTLELVPDHEGTLLDLAMSYLVTGQPREALRVRQRLDRLRGRPAQVWLALVYAHLDRAEEARELLAQGGQGASSQFSLAAAWAHVELGDPETAIDVLERDHERPGWNMMMLNMDWLPFLESLEGHPRYQDLLRRIDFPEN